MCFIKNHENIIPNFMYSYEFENTKEHITAFNKSFEKVIKNLLY